MARKLRADEFEARQRQLPASHKRYMGGGSLAKSRTDLSRTPLGSPPVCADVRSVFDVRPINAFDFAISKTDGVQSDTISTFATCEMIVPDGFVAVLRSLDIDLTTGVPVGDYHYDLMLNGSVFGYNERIYFGNAKDDCKHYMIADEFNRIGARVVITPPITTDDAFLRVTFRGTFLLKTEQPAHLEIANPTENCRPVQTLRKPPPPPPPIPVFVAPSPAPIAPIAPPKVAQVAKPPFPVSWRSARSSSGMVAIPMQNDQGQRRDLSSAEISRYTAYLNPIWPGRNGNPL